MVGVSALAPISDSAAVFLFFGNLEGLLHHSTARLRLHIRFHERLHPQCESGWQIPSPICQEFSPRAPAIERDGQGVQCVPRHWLLISEPRFLSLDASPPRLRRACGGALRLPCSFATTSRPDRTTGGLGPYRQAANGPWPERNRYGR